LPLRADPADRNPRHANFENLGHSGIKANNLRNFLSIIMKVSPAEGDVFHTESR
jgi:hypothetical protein